MNFAERIALVVEDDDLSAKVLQLFLEANGFVVLHCSSGEDALLLAPKQPLSLITLDLRLPTMNGWQFLQRLRENAALTEVPVVIISGLAVTKAAPGLATWHGVVRTLEKPFTRAQLDSVLSELGFDPAPLQTA